MFWTEAYNLEIESISQDWFHTTHNLDIDGEYYRNYMTIVATERVEYYSITNPLSQQIRVHKITEHVL